MICCCSLAGTVACRNCPNNYYTGPHHQREIVSTFYTDPKEYEPFTKNMKISCVCKCCDKAITILDNFCSNCGTKNEQKYVDGGIME